MRHVSNKVVKRKAKMPSSLLELQSIPPSPRPTGRQTHTRWMEVTSPHPTGAQDPRTL